MDLVKKKRRFINFKLIFSFFSMILYFILAVGIVLAWFTSNTKTRASTNSVRVIPKDLEVFYEVVRKPDKYSSTEENVKNNVNFSDMLPDNAVIYTIGIEKYSSNETMLKFIFGGLYAEVIDIDYYDADFDMDGLSGTIADMYTFSYAVNGAEEETDVRIGSRVDKSLITNNFFKGDFELFSINLSGNNAPHTVTITIAFEPFGSISLSQFNNLANRIFSYDGLIIDYS